MDGSTARRLSKLLASFGLALAFLIAAPTALAVTLFATNGTQIASFDSATPGTTTTVGITGLGAGEAVTGIDCRPAIGQVYAVTSLGNLYTLNTASGAATLVSASPIASATGGSPGFDFNPVFDFARFMTGTVNIRINPNGTLIATDIAPNPGNPAVVGLAYSNNVAGAASTTLYAIDSGTDSLYTLSNPNGGTLTLVGSLGVDTSSSVGFDIAANGTAYAALTVGGTAGLYTINLGTGTATLVGRSAGASLRRA
jgi:Domain of unknown function (DUF4394)